MKKLVIVLLFCFMITGLYGCCFGGSDNQTSETLKNYENLKPLDYMAEMSKLQKSNQKLFQEMQNPNANISEIEKKLIQNEEKITRLNEAFQKSKFFKEMENSNNPFIQQAMQAQEQARQTMQEQEDMMKESNDNQ